MKVPPMTLSKFSLKKFICPYEPHSFTFSNASSLLSSPHRNSVWKWAGMLVLAWAAGCNLILSDRLLLDGVYLSLLNSLYTSRSPSLTAPQKCLPVKMCGHGLISPRLQASMPGRLPSPSLGVLIS